LRKWFKGGNIVASVHALLEHDDAPGGVRCAGLKENMTVIARPNARSPGYSVALYRITGSAPNKKLELVNNVDGKFGWVVDVVSNGTNVVVLLSRGQLESLPPYHIYELVSYAVGRRGLLVETGRSGEITAQRGQKSSVLVNIDAKSVVLMEGGQFRGQHLIFTKFNPRTLVQIVDRMDVGEATASPKAVAISSDKLALRKYRWEKHPKESIYISPYESWKFSYESGFVDSAHGAIADSHALEWDRDVLVAAAQPSHMKARSSVAIVSTKRAPYSVVTDYSDVPMEALTFSYPLAASFNAVHNVVHWSVIDVTERDPQKGQVVGSVMLQEYNLPKPSSSDSKSVLHNGFLDKDDYVFYVNGYGVVIMTAQ